MSEDIVEEMSEKTLEGAYRQAGRDFKIGIKELLIERCEECISTMIFLQFVIPEKIVTVD